MLTRTRRLPTAPDGGLRRSGWPVFVRLLVSLVVLFAVYLGVSWYAGRSIPPGTQVAGVSVGGLTEEQAADRIGERLDQIRRTPVKVTWPGGTKRVEPATLGLSVDPRASVAGLTEFTLDPRRVWERLSRDASRPGVVAVDAGVADRALQSWAGEIDRPATEGAVTFDKGSLQVTAPQEGRRLDLDATRSAIAVAWPASTDVAAVLATTAPAVPPARFEAAVNDVAKRAVSGPLTVRSGQANGTMTPEQFGTALRMETDGGDLVLRVDEQRFLDAARQAVPGLETEAANARIVLSPGAPPRVEPGVTGWKVQRGEVADVVRAALTAPERTAVLPVQSTVPAVTTEQLTAWGITTPVATAELPAPDDPVRQAVLADLVAPLDGVLLAPNATFAWPVAAAAGATQGADGDEPLAAIDAVRRAATAAGLTVTGDAAAGSVTLVNPGAAGVVLQVDRSGQPARLVVWGRGGG